MIAVPTIALISGTTLIKPEARRRVYWTKVSTNTTAGIEHIRKADSIPEKTEPSAEDGPSFGSWQKTAVRVSYEAYLQKSGMTRDVVNQRSDSDAQRWLVRPGCDDVGSTGSISERARRR